MAKKTPSVCLFVCFSRILNSGDSRKKGCVLQYSKEIRRNMKYAWMTVFGFGFIFFMTALGAALVFCFRGKISKKWNTVFFGFASGIMLSASVWSLLLPAFEQITPKWGEISVVPVAVSFLSGCALLIILDIIVVLVRGKTGQNCDLQGAIERKNQKILLAVALHNIPEGLAVGFAFGAARVLGAPAAYTSALLLAIGIGVQNFPEGAAISLPLAASKTKTKAFVYGVVSGLPEPIFALIGYVLSTQIAFLQPWLLAFSAGAMFFVVADELLPSTGQEQSKTSSVGAVAAAIGFVLMMMLDVALG